MQNSLYNPTLLSQLSNVDAQLNFQGKQFSPAKNASTNCDFKVVEDSILDGARLVVSNADDGDTIDIKIIDIDNVLGLGANYVVRTVVTDWPLPAGANTWDFNAAYPNKLKDGLYIRVVYKSNASALEPATSLAVGYRLHKILW